MHDPNEYISTTGVEIKLLQRISQISLPKRNASDISLTDSLVSDLNIDSLGFIELIIEIENTFDISFDDDYLMMDAYANVGDVLEYVAKAMSSK